MKFDSKKNKDYKMQQNSKIFLFFNYNNINNNNLENGQLL